LLNWRGAEQLIGNSLPVLIGNITTG